MKRWEVAKGIQEDKFGYGTKFKVEFPDGEIGYAIIDDTGALRWNVDGATHLVPILSFDEDVWSVMFEADKEEEKFVKITQERLDYLEEREEFLNCLEACGVDNWEGYGDAYEMMEEE